MRIVTALMVSLLWVHLAIAESADTTSYMDSAQASIDQQDWDHAESNLIHVIKHNFKHVQARYLLGKVAEQREAFRLAKKRYKMVLFIDRKHMLALKGWGRVSEKLDSSDELVAYQRAMRIEPDNASWHLKMAQYYMKHTPLKAKRFLRNVLRLDPNNRQALQLMIEFHQNYTLISHAETYQRRLRELPSNLTVSSEQRSPTAFNHKKHEAPSVAAVQEQMEKSMIIPSLLPTRSKLWVQKLRTPSPSLIKAVPSQTNNAINPKDYPEKQQKTQTDIHLFQQYQVAVKEGKAADQFLLALMYHEGRGVSKNDAQAVYLLRQAAIQGLDRAQFTLGLMLYETRSNHMKERAALKWFKRAAKQGSTEAMYALGLIYATNDNYKDEIKAVKWWESAALQGHAKAQHNLGVMYFYGQGVAKNRMQARRWLQQNAEHNYSNISVNVDQLYSDSGNNMRVVSVGK